MNNDEFKLIKSVPHLGYFMDDGSIYATINIYGNESLINLEHAASNINGPYTFDFIIPRKAAKWIADAIQNKFWKSPEDGGLPMNQHHLIDEIEGETIEIRRVMTVARPGQKGFHFYNHSRLDPDLSDPQEFYTPDIMLLEGGLLEILENL